MAGVALYAIAGFLVAPRAIKLWIESPNVSGPTCRLRAQQVYVNPFTLFLSLNNVTLIAAENKLSVSATGVDTKIWTLEMFRTERRGRDIVVRNLVVTRGGSTEAVLAAPRASARNISVDDRTCLAFDEFATAGGRLRWTDGAVTPSVQLELRDVAAKARREPGAASTEIDFEGRIGPTGSLRVTAQLRGPNVRNADRLSLLARNVDLVPLSPYSRRLYGRDIVAGLGDITLRHEPVGTRGRLDTDLSIAGLRLGNPDPANAANALPLDLALALATDPADHTRLSFEGSVADSRLDSIAGTFVIGLTQYLAGLAAKPFEVLAGIAGDTDAAVDAIPFVPGSAEMAPAAADKLAQLAAALGQRPRLGIRVRPAYDPAADRDAIAAQQVRLHIALATSAGERGAGAGPDFGDPRVRDVLDEFAGSRLSASQRRALALQESNDTDRYRQIFRALVDHEAVSETVLRRLARFRARSVIDALDREGIDRGRFHIADALDTTSTVSETIPLQLEPEVLRASFGNPDRLFQP